MMCRLPYLLLLVLLLVSCAKEDQEPLQPEWEGPVIELELSCVNPSSPTKAGSNGTEYGENSYHENDLKWVDFYFYPGGATYEQASYHIRKESGRRENDVFRLELTTNQVNYLIFPVLKGITETTVLAIANAPKVNDTGTILDELDDTSMGNIMAQVASADFANDHYLNHRQEQFVMSGQASISLAGRSQKVVSQGLVELKRYASKITVGIKMEDKVEVERKDSQGNPYVEEWTPRPYSMQIYLVNGVKKVTLNGNPAGTLGGVALDSDVFFDYGNNRMKFFDDDQNPYFDKSGDFYNTFPSYTYPYHWEPGSEKEPYLKLVMTWDRKPSGERLGTQREFYYKILIPQDRRGGEFLNTFFRNNWYHYDIEVGVLGADTDEEAVPLTASMYVVDWQEKEVVVNKANIGNARYLSVDGSEFTMYNQPALSIHYTTSNPIELKNIHATRPYYGEDKTLGPNSRYGGDVKQVDHTDTDDYDDIYPDKSYYLEYSAENWLQFDSKYIILTHTLNNNYQSESFDYSPYTITFDVRHADSQESWMRKYDKHVKITQYPGIFIDATPNPDTITDNKDKSTTANHGYVYVNNVHKEWYTQEDYFAEGSPADKLWRTIAYNGGGTDMYKINTTVLAANSGFVIGDPRVATVTNPTRSYIEAPDINGVKRTLTYYYPADGTERTKDMIAPAYRVSTKLSGAARSQEVTYADAFDRCAAFQENGFPAGRWRLPTEGEIRFISSLSARGVFEWQFSGNYWSSNGGVNVNTSSGNVTSKPDLTRAYVRCVYDSWYWGDGRVLNEDTGMPDTFTWGDVKR